MKQFLSFIGPAIANHLWQSTVFAVAAWLVTLLLHRNRASVRYGIWLVASVKFLIPFTLLIGLGRWLPKPQNVVAGSQAAIYSAVDAVGQPFSNSSPEVVPTGKHPSLKQSFLGALPMILLGAWLCGFLVVMLVWVVRWRQVSATLWRAAELPDGREVYLLRRVEQELHVRRPLPLLLSQELMEPGIFGILRPVLIWPEQLSERLEEEHIEAIMTHELVHTRRHDNMASAMHMAVEAAFWFHPMLWWMERRIVEERERACDEAVVEMGRKPGIYADGLLKTCRFCMEARLTCVAGVTGGDLKTRIVRIMACRSRINLNLSRRLLLIAAGLTAIFLPVFSGFAHVIQDGAGSQAKDAAAKLPVFEVASIKQTKLFGGRVMFRLTPDGISVTGVPMQMILRQAFGVEEDRIVGAPNWVNSDRFEIQAKVGVEDAPKLQGLTRNQRFSMVLPLLIDRFNLKYHHESKEREVYGLVIAKGGSKMNESKADDPGPERNLLTGAGKLEAHASAVESLAHQLSFLLGRTVLDRTGLTGRYDYTLTWVPGDEQPGPANTSSPDASGPSIFTALQEQLGLKLESQKGPIDVIVIDHIEKPSEN